MNGSVALQMIMNPHFFYNTLNLMSSMAGQGECDMVASCCEDLALLTRYLSQEMSCGVTVEEERPPLEAYLRIMHLRFEDVHIRIELQAELLTRRIPKLTLLSACDFIFENGFSAHEPPYRLNIFSKNSEQTGALCILANCELDVGMVQALNECIYKQTGQEDGAYWHLGEQLGTLWFPTIIK